MTNKIDKTDKGFIIAVIIFILYFIGLLLLGLSKSTYHDNGTKNRTTCSSNIICPSRNIICKTYIFTKTK